MTFKELLIRFNPITCKNQLNKILALTERNFGVFSRDMELDIRSIIKDIEVEAYFDRIIHEEHPKLEYDKKPDIPNKQNTKNTMPWDNEGLDCTLIGIDFNYPSNVTVCVAYRQNGKLKREIIEIETYTISKLAEEKYVFIQKARSLMLAYTLLTLKRQRVRFDYIHYALRGKNTHSIDDLWAIAIGVYEQLQLPNDIVTNYGQYQIKASKSEGILKRIYKIILPNNEFFKWGLPINSNIPRAVAIYLTNPTRLRERRRKEYQKYVNIEKAKAKKEKKAKKKITGDGTFSFIKSKWGKSWGSYNLIDD